MSQSDPLKKHDHNPSRAIISPSLSFLQTAQQRAEGGREASAFKWAGGGGNSLVNQPSFYSANRLLVRSYPLIYHDRNIRYPLSTDAIYTANFRNFGQKFFQFISKKSHQIVFRNNANLQKDYMYNLQKDCAYPSSVKNTPQNPVHTIPPYA